MFPAHAGVDPVSQELCTQSATAFPAPAGVGPVPDKTKGPLSMLRLKDGIRA